MARGGQVHIRATADRVWSLLTDAKGFPRWNSKVASVEGQIREGEKLRLRVPGTERTFTPEAERALKKRHREYRARQR